MIEDVEKNKRSNIERLRKECGHQKGARESKRNETTLVWTHAENGRKRSESSVLVT